ncbi:hypothetical protein LCGC14_1305120 [marine sediment metagenome]|uniref:Uncharacterized protein n=1 Tax=marine sediment metagenome TaxID=412755 RepID=A0A0F9KNZ1_9ZZZZ
MKKEDIPKCSGLKEAVMGADKRYILIDDEDILNLKSAIDKLLPTAEPYVDLEIFTLKSIIDKYEESGS